MSTIFPFRVDANDPNLVDWDGAADPENPFHWSRRRKWTVTLTACLIAILTGIPAGSYGVANTKMSEKFHIDESKFPYLAFGLVSWSIGAGLCPLLFVPLAENIGRRPVYMASYLLFITSLVPCALAPNFATIVTARFVGGGAASVATVIAAGTISDVWKGDQQRSLPVATFSVLNIVGIALGPLVGGVVLKYLEWPWIYWTQLIFDAALLPVFFLVLKETRGQIILARRAKTLRTSGRPAAYALGERDKPRLLQLLRISFMRPTKMLWTELVVISVTLWVSFAWGILYLFQSSITIVFEETYHFNPLATTLAQVALSVGALLSFALNPIQDKLYLNSARKDDKEGRAGRRNPEARLYFSIGGSACFTVGILWNGWTATPHLHWIVPMLGIVLVGAGVFAINVATINYLADAYEKYAASALAAASLGMNIFGAFLPLATPALYRSLGARGASMVLGSVGLALACVPVGMLF